MSEETAPTAEPAPVTETKAAPEQLSLDDLVKADLAFKKSKGATEAELTAKRAELDAEAEKFRPLAPVLEHMTKGEVVEAIWNLTKGKINPEQVLALVDRVAEQHEGAEVSVEERVAAALKAERDATKKAEDEARAKAEEDGRSEWSASLENYVKTAFVGTKEEPGYLKQHAEEFPLCVAWRNKITIEAVEAELQRRLKADESLSAKDVLTHFEAKFQEEIDQTPFGRRKEAPPEVSGFEARENAFFLKNKPPAEVVAKPGPTSAQPTEAPTGFTVAPGKSFDESVAEYFSRRDRERKARMRF